MANRIKNNKTGFTLIELLISIALVLILFISFTTFFINYMTLYYGLQSDASNSIEMAEEIERIASVLRGLTNITTATPNSLTAYAYFAPNDQYVSLISYYLNSAGNQLLATVTPMTSNPPTGTPITSEQKTYVIISNYYQSPSGQGIFSYYDSTGNELSQPISNEQDISSIAINLSAPATHNSNGQSLSTTITIRNRRVST
ncbi:MAG: prepilin-type N-terminal cleavage/methylation domain-containing protein [Patescibacteria group bacterium]|nr:prepilin-type N-terminal cleavage/methylation domain-containing protein [Patescibacteria group bacterium]